MKFKGSGDFVSFRSPDPISVMSHLELLIPNFVSSSQQFSAPEAHSSFLGSDC